MIVSAVGQDALGRQALTALQEHDVDTACVSILPQPTGTVHIELNQDGSARYEFATNCAWDNLPSCDRLPLSARQADVVCFGTLAQRSEPSRNSIQRFLKQSRSDALRVFDINLRAPYFTDEIILQSLELANVLKLNDEELPRLADLLGLSGPVNEQIRQLADRFDLIAVALTRGANGATLLRNGEIDEHAGVAADVVDTVGAGDAFTAAFTFGLLQRADLRAINQRACAIAAYVCGQAGATPKFPPHLCQASP